MKRLLIIDVDGTLTDGKLYYGESGECIKAFNVKDGYAIKEELPLYSIIPVIITSRESPMVEKRCLELGIVELYQGCKEKGRQIEELCQKYGLEPNMRMKVKGLFYIGDDIPDITGMRMSELSGCPHDACRDVKLIADYICEKDGGYGAVREFIEWIIAQL